MNKIFAVSFVLIFSLFLSGCGEKKPVITITPTPTPEMKILKDGEGPTVDLVSRADRQAVTLKIASISADIKSIEYSLVYDTNGVQRGVLGTLDNKGKTSIVKELLLASCSKNVCVFDKNVTKLQLDVKFTTDGEPLIFQKEFDL